MVIRAENRGTQFLRDRNKKGESEEWLLKTTYYFSKVFLGDRSLLFFLVMPLSLFLEQGEGHHEP